MERTMKRFSWLAWIFSAVAGSGCLFVVLVLFEWFLPRNETKIISSIDLLAKAGVTDDHISQYDLICFDHGNIRLAEDFRKAASKQGVDISASLQSCGVDSSCCTIMSDVSGTIGLIKDDKIRCVGINRITFLTIGDVGICAKPSNLRISEEIFAKGFNPPGRPWFSIPGQSYYRILRPEGQ
jgi:hypothetical protein